MDIGFHTIKGYWYRYHFKKYHIVPLHSYIVLLMILISGKLSFIRDC